MLAETKINANKILNNVEVISTEINAPKTLPGMDNNPNLIPIEYSILFCLAYDKDEDTALLNTAKRLLLTATVGGNPKNVKTGTMIIPPPNPMIEPNNPAINPSGINQRFSNIIQENKNITVYIAFFVAYFNFCDDIYQACAVPTKSFHKYPSVLVVISICNCFPSKLRLDLLVDLIALE